MALNHALHARPESSNFITTTAAATTTTPLFSSSRQIGINRRGNLGSVVKQSSLLGRKVCGSGCETVRKWKLDGPRRRTVVRSGLSLVPEKPLGLYDPSYDKDSCGVGFVAELSGTANRQTV